MIHDVHLEDQLCSWIPDISMAISEFCACHMPALQAMLSMHVAHLDWPGSSISKCTDGVALNLLCNLIQHVNLLDASIATDLQQKLDKPLMLCCLLLKLLCMPERQRQTCSSQLIARALITVSRYD